MLPSHKMNIICIFKYLYFIIQIFDSVLILMSILIKYLSILS